MTMSLKALSGSVSSLRAGCSIGTLHSGFEVRLGVSVSVRDLAQRAAHEAEADRGPVPPRLEEILRAFKVDDVPAL